jgi:hypothetical protein
MARQRGTDDLYTGRSGQAAVLAELLLRKCNAAIPEVDVGMDVFASHDQREAVARIQVKTAQGERYKKEQGHHAQFDLPLKQLERTDHPALHYILAVRLERTWEDFLVLPRLFLQSVRSNGGRLGTVNEASGNLVLTVQCRPAGVLCGDVDLTLYRNAWDRLPPLRTPPPEPTD